MSEPDHIFSVAPMMDWTDRYDRVFLRLITRRALLYTEMIPSGAILHGDRGRFLDFDAREHPVALQLGGSDPEQLADCVRIARDWGYDEANLNVGCPSDRVTKGRFGACLMAEPDLVATCLTAMTAASDLPVTVKSRTGVDDRDSYADLLEFTQRIRDAGCRTLIVHARKAWLTGLSPKKNREVPPLRYDMVYRLKEDFPELRIVLNGGIETLEAAAEHLAHVDGIMVGRAAYRNPFMLADVDRRFFGDPNPASNRETVVRELIPYAARQCERGVPLKALTRHVLGLFNGEPGARAWRRHLSTAGVRPAAGPEVIEEALKQVISAQQTGSDAAGNRYSKCQVPSGLKA